MAIFVIRDGDRGTGSTGYRQGDIIDVVDDMYPARIPPSVPYWLVRAIGISAAEAQQYMQQGTDEGRRTWIFRMNKPTQAQQTFLQTNRFIGFASPYMTPIGQQLGIEGDFNLTWDEVGTWLQNKVTNNFARTARV